LICRNYAFQDQTDHSDAMFSAAHVKENQNELPQNDNPFPEHSIDTDRDSLTQISVIQKQMINNLDTNKKAI
jgi:hypothetical protein